MSGITRVIRRTAILSCFARGSETALLRRTLWAIVLIALPLTASGQVLSFPARGDLVVFSAIAVDGKGRPVTDLRSRDFRIYEEGRPQSISRFYGALAPRSLQIAPRSLE